MSVTRGAMENNAACRGITGRGCLKNTRREAATQTTLQMYQGKPKSSIPVATARAAADKAFQEQGLNSPGPQTLAGA